MYKLVVGIVLWFAVLGGLGWGLPIWMVWGCGSSFTLTSNTHQYSVGTPQVVAGQMAPACFVPSKDQIRVQPRDLLLGSSSLTHEAIHSFDWAHGSGYLSEYDAKVLALVDKKTYRTQNTAEWVASASTSWAATPDCIRVLNFGWWAWLLPLCGWAALIFNMSVLCVVLLVAMLKLMSLRARIVGHGLTRLWNQATTWEERFAVARASMDHDLPFVIEGELARVDSLKCDGSWFSHGTSEYTAESFS